MPAEISRQIEINIFIFQIVLSDADYIRLADGGCEHSDTDESKQSITPLEYKRYKNGIACQKLRRNEEIACTEDRHADDDIDKSKEQ
jgi:hypothetical protein